MKTRLGNPESLAALSLERALERLEPDQTNAPREAPERKDQKKCDTPIEHSRVFRIVAFVAIGAMGILILAGLFSPGLRYSLSTPPEAAVDAPSFLNELEPLVSSRITRDNQIDVLENGENFYEAELEAMRRAQHSINIEAYIFHKGKVAEQVLGVLTERARAGARVNLVMDSLGSLSTPKAYFEPLRAAGGRVEWYHRLRLHNWFITNNRTHREITIVDGSTAFIGGAGFADWWRYSKDDEPRWRDTMVRVQGHAVRGIQGTFVENWLEASGEILNGSNYFPVLNTDPGTAVGLVVSSSPSSGGSTHSRLLMQTLIAAARRSVYITTPYFLPDRSMREELVRAKTRGVAVRIIVPGKRDDHALTRSSGRRAYGDLLKAGADIYEYEPAMIHGKIAIVDGVWSVVGSANFDNRSFGINDEINLAIFDPLVAAKLTRDFEDDAAHSERVSLEAWEKRSASERLLEAVGWIIERQQ
jgi:cardiolipin synthase